MKSNSPVELLSRQSDPLVPIFPSDQQNQKFCNLLKISLSTDKLCKNFPHKSTTQRPKRSKRPKKRRRKKTTTTTLRPNYNNYDYYDDYENEIPDKESPKQDVGSGQNLGFFVSLLNFFGMFGDHYTDYDTGEASSRQGQIFFFL